MLNELSFEMNSKTENFKLEVESLAGKNFEWFTNVILKMEKDLENESREEFQYTDEIIAYLAELESRDIYEISEDFRHICLIAGDNGRSHKLYFDFNSNSTKPLIQAELPLLGDSFKSLSWQVIPIICFIFFL